MYHSYIHSHLTYALSIWGPLLSKAQSNRIFKLQKKAVRLIDNAPYNSPSTPLFKKYKILKFDDLISLELLKLTHSYRASNLPVPVSDLFTNNAFNHRYNTRFRHHPRVSYHKSSLFHRSFLTQSPILWQNLPNSIRKIKPINTFVNHLKAYYINKY